MFLGKDCSIESTVYRVVWYSTLLLYILAIQYRLYLSCSDTVLQVEEGGTFYFFSSEPQFQKESHRSFEQLDE